MREEFNLGQYVQKYFNSLSEEFAEKFPKVNKIHDIICIEATVMHVGKESVTRRFEGKDRKPRVYSSEEMSEQELSDVHSFLRNADLEEIAYSFFGSSLIAEPEIQGVEIDYRKGSGFTIDLTT